MGMAKLVNADIWHRDTGNLIGVETRRPVDQDVGDKAPLTLRIARANMRASGMV